MASEQMTYAGTGVQYEILDFFKRAAQTAARETAGNIDRLNGGEFKEFKPSRGESAYIIEAAKSYFAHVEEGLGTKNLVADAMYKLTGKSFYDYIAQDTVAMIVNDMITTGALPLSVAMHLAVGESSWFDDTRRSSDLITGWKNACDMAGCVWGGGETPTLKDMLLPGVALLAGSAVGLVKPKGRLIRAENIRHGDRIILIESSGIHANGLTMARKIAEKLPRGYLTKLPDGRTYGETLLDPTHIYVRFVEACLDAGVDIHYAVNITGHGWRKLMRAPQPFEYVVQHLPDKLPIFDFIQKHGPVSKEEMYGNFNMGAGFALYIPYGHMQRFMAVAGRHHFKTWDAGIIRESLEKKVSIRPLGLEYAADTLAVR
ncbi:MAG: AIR synthase-related protein [Candidatus Adlerbacteria bacterium]|nr:AIR synthase-related protein [Candidatus Adlerbacteria bacterium]